MAFNVPDYKTYYNEGLKNLEAYYRRILSEEYGDINRAMARLKEDYTRGNRITMEDYTRELSFAKESGGAAKQEEAMTSEAEQRALERNLLSRGVSVGGLADTAYGRQEDKAKLRREAIDRALRKSEEDLQYGKERGLEENTIAQRRGTEDVASNWQKFQTQKGSVEGGKFENGQWVGGTYKPGQETQEKAQQLGEQAYQREFAKRSTEESFKQLGSAGGGGGGGSSDNYGGSYALGDSRLQHLEKMGARNPVQEREYQELKAKYG